DAPEHPRGDRDRPGARRPPHLSHPPHARDRTRRARGPAAGRHRAGLRWTHRGDPVIRLAYGRMFQDSLDRVHGLPRARLDALADRRRAFQAEVNRRRGQGEYGFYRLVDQAGPVHEITRFAEGVGQAYDHVLVLGIGGSALGAKALLNALRRPAWNEWDDEG